MFYIICFINNKLKDNCYLHTVSKEIKNIELKINNYARLSSAVYIRTSPPDFSVNVETFNSHLLHLQ